MRRDAEGRRLLLLAGLGALLTAAAIVAVHRASPRSFVSAHGMLHIAVFQRFGSPWSFLSAPPENPFFAGEALPYYWFYHYVAARFGDLVAISPPQAFELLVVGAIALAWFSGASLGRAIYGGVLPGIAIGLFTFAGANPFGAGFLAARFALHGNEVFVDDPSYLWGIVHPMIRLARFEDPFVLYGPMINFFLNVTSRPLALALLVFLALAAFRYLEGGRGVWVFALIAGSALCTALAPIIGLSALPTLAVALCLARAAPSAWMRDAGREDGGPGGEATGRRWIVAAVALLAGVVITVPTYRHLLGLTGGEAVRIAPSLRIAMATAASAGLIGALGLVATWRASGLRRRFLAAIMLSAAVLIATSILVRLPVSNDSNFFHAGAVLLGVPAAGVFVPSVDRKRRWIAPAVLLCVFLPTPLVVLYSYLGRPDVPLVMDGSIVRRVPETDPWAEVYAWIRAETPPDAVIITDPRPRIVTSVGNFPELPALTGRFLFTTRRENYVVSPNEDADVRERIATTLVDGGRLGAPDERYLDALGRRIYLVRDVGGAEEPVPEEGLGPAVFRSGPLRVHEVR